MFQPLRKHRIRRHGATMVEGAFVLGILLSLLLGMMELCIATLETNTLAYAAQHLARTAAVHGELAGNSGVWGPQPLSLTANQSHAAAQCVRPLLGTMDPTQVHLTLEWPDGDAAYDSRVRVTATYRHHAILSLLSPLLSRDLQAVSVMRVAH